MRMLQIDHSQIANIEIRFQMIVRDLAGHAFHPDNPDVAQYSDSDVAAILRSHENGTAEWILGATEDTGRTVLRAEAQEILADVPAPNVLTSDAIRNLAETYREALTEEARRREQLYLSGSG